MPLLGEDCPRPSQYVLASVITHVRSEPNHDDDTPGDSVEPEPNHPDPGLRRVSYAELYALVADLVSAFLARGLKAGDRIASYSSNCIVRIPNVPHARDGLRPGVACGARAPLGAPPVRGGS